ncbi:Extracellular ligand-binding receptor OS=Pirellula staleyi (strain ATCC 27377 / DSM 6068 / ICPB 4128) GN=Psta_4547 PE=4 SV=1: Peripla_BP_6 [Gemmata massiliana]|uniref:Leucine-binding protein domain-containing protein n=1 Tax=Gemmata massiliana TaxID=1210884 RepID=A0A6P2CY72_9BACT|nr:branched-chain amino acid ABC transporter substrate-binding protein [Gemmata massiliana]VTR92082.1 Extracellular ligand-binding receptor OS=Pirellula staleyi (strain ATCC 27377 / DSM 6068 / ICPB 4128) GN=Psta_4547 PE=4 SV=1: Peripla_BP_6 [Gemmata massiliana]
MKNREAEQNKAQARPVDRRKFLALGGITTTGILLGTGGGGSNTSGNSNAVKIISSLPRTGSAKGQTDTIVNGIKMAFDEVDNKAGEFTIEYLDLDDATPAEGKWTPERETANADQAVKDTDVMAFIGPYNSGAAKVSMPILNKAGVLMISPAVTWPGLTKPGKGDPGEPDIYKPTGKVNFTRVVPADDLQGPLGADWAKSMGVKTVAVLDDNEVYGKGIATLFKERCLEAGIKVLGQQESIDVKQNEFSGVLRKLKTLGTPDLLYFGGTSQTKAGQIAKDMVAVGFGGVKLMVPDGCYELAFIQSAGAELFKTLKCFITFGGSPPDKLTGRGKEFVDKYKAKYGKDPEGYAIYGYEAGKVAVEAIKRAGKKDRAAVLAECLKIKDFDGALGKWSFDENGDTTSRTMSGSTIEGGDFKFVKQLG